MQKFGAKLAAILTVSFILCTTLCVEAQGLRSSKVKISGGHAPTNVTSLIGRKDSTAMAKDAIVDSLGQNIAAQVDSLPLLSTDSVAVRMTTDKSVVVTDVPKQRPHKERRFRCDSMSLSAVTASTVFLPGFGQIYNKQYWKLPILYSTFGVSLGFLISENSKYQPIKKQYDNYIATNGLTRTKELDAIQTRLIKQNTTRQILLGTTIASCVYFIGDAIVNYSTTDSHVARATALSMFCPGAGQIYNKQYWKVPIVIGGFATTIYCIDWNNRGYKRFKSAYELRVSYDKKLEEYNKNPDAFTEAPTPTDEFKGRLSPSALKSYRDSYRRNRDLCIIITAALYALQVIDAHVDAQFSTFDISDNLSMNVDPMLGTVQSRGGSTEASFGVNVGVRF